MERQVHSSALFAFPFRPFFLLCAAYGALSVGLWVAAVTGLGNPLPALPSPQWHAHEMLYGFVPAAIAGFLLTAMCNWTGARPLAGPGLVALVLLWLAGRLAMCLQGALPYALVAALDGAFLPLLALYAGTVLWRSRNQRNYGLVAVLLALAVGNGLMHAAVVARQPALAATGLALGLDLIALLMVVVAGRITPAFSANWLRGRGGSTPAPAPAWVAYAAIGSLAAMALADLLRAPAAITGTLALLAGLANALRLLYWAGWRTVREPLLWILHLAYGFIALALLLRAALQFGLLHNPSLWHHSLGAGAIGILILGVMTRVSMGHTGRPLRLLPGGLLIFMSVILAALLRLAVAAGWLPYQGGLWASALAWIGAYVLFVLLYGPVLWAPRPDGKPG
ncbi:NnrS family protein [Parahaliea mediterranea]|uniref:NnrS family protein n=1 Tax=Parahaliea mediterranea TaxID=651086 RepID=UPI000E2F4278|nr:NnrS family protein [Parahaliea mediterranea]